MPYVYSIEEKVHGDNLFNVWGKLDKQQREQCLSELINILKTLHNEPVLCDDAINKVLTKYDDGLNKIANAGILPSKKVLYLEELRQVLLTYFSDARLGLIHGDIHFNNIIYTENGLRLIDFENCEAAPLDKEFDSIARMTRNPNSYIKPTLQSLVDPKDYECIMPFIIERYPEICHSAQFYN